MTKMIDMFRPRLSDLEPVATCHYPDGPFVATDIRPCVRCGTEHSWDALHPVLCPDCKNIRLPVVPHKSRRERRRPNPDTPVYFPTCANTGKPVEECDCLEGEEL